MVFCEDLLVGDVVDVEIILAIRTLEIETGGTRYVWDAQVLNAGHRRLWRRSFCALTAYLLQNRQNCVVIVTANRNLVVFPGGVQLADLKKVECAAFIVNNCKCLVACVVGDLNSIIAIGAELVVDQGLQLAGQICRRADHHVADRPAAEDNVLATTAQGDREGLGLTSHLVGERHRLLVEVGVLLGGADGDVIDRRRDVGCGGQS